MEKKVSKLPKIYTLSDDEIVQLKWADTSASDSADPMSDDEEVKHDATGLAKSLERPAKKDPHQSKLSKLRKKGPSDAPKSEK